MSNFDPSHRAFIAYKVETETITESPDGDTPAILPAIPTLPTVIGHMDVPERTTNLNNGIGYAIGTPYGAYNRRGRVEHDIRLSFRIGSLSFLPQCLINSTTLAMPKLAIFVCVQGKFTEVYRYAQCSELQLQFSEGGAAGGGGELMATASFWAEAKQEGPIMSVTEGTILALGKPLFWHDVRQFTINGTDYRPGLISTSATVANNLERKGERPNWGDHEPLSRSVEEIISHTHVVNGEAQFHKRLSRSLLYAAADSQDWGDVVIRCTDGPALPVGGTARPYVVTLHTATPTRDVGQASAPNAQLSYTVPYAARKLSIALV